MLKEADTPEKKKVLLVNKIEDSLNTIVRQMAFHEFEDKVHNAIKEGELTSLNLTANKKTYLEQVVKELGLPFDEDMIHN